MRKTDPETAPPEIAAYGSWSSPITSDRIAAHPIRLGDVAVDGDAVYWVEARPSENGRGVIVKREPDGTIRDILKAPYNARTLVHEYGGTAFLVHDGIVFFCNLDPKAPRADQRLYRIGSGNADPVAITPDVGDRYADMDFDANRRRILAVRESRPDADKEPRNEIVAIAADEPGEVSVLVSGADFYAAPRLSPDGAMLAWICWNHPAMPWTDTEVWLADISAAGTVKNPRRIAGGPGVSVVQPSWSPGGDLYFVTDESNWWNLARFVGDAVEIVLRREAEFAQPLWQLGASHYAFLSDDTMVAAYGESGFWHLGLVDLSRRALRRLDLPHIAFRSVKILRGKKDVRAVAIAASAVTPEEVIEIELETAKTTSIRRSFALDTDITAYFTTPESIAFPTRDGTTAFGFYYPPSNPAFIAPAAEKPPLIVMSHGGPTAAASAALALSRQFWTSRGFAVVDVNYRGSTGYGRAYRRGLEGRWGIADVDDCIAAAQFLIDRDKADAARIGITGGSAGGYTTLCALTFHDFFKAGASHYGIGDLEALARDTHKFESRYLDGLIGSYPRDRDTYLARSPIHHVEKLSVPVAFFQGAEDKVVPPEQADAMVAALRARNCPAAYLLFEDEQHGFRKSANIRRALDAELLFFSMWLSGTQLRFSGE